MTVQRVLIIRPGALGDTLMLLPALKDLAGKVSVAFVGRQPGLDFIRPHVDRAMDLEASEWRRLFMDPPDVERLPVSDVKMVTAFFGDEDGVIRRNLRSALPHAAVHLFRSFPLDGEAIHAADYLARCLKSAGLPVDPARSIQAVRNGALCKRTRLSARGNRIVFHPGSGSLTKNHPPGFWLDLIVRLSSETGFGAFRPVLLTGPAEESLYPYFKDKIGSRAVLISSPGREALIRMLDEAALFLGHDSGITHLSAMRCVPTVALFKGSNAAQWAPLGPFVRLIENENPGPELLERIIEACRAFIGTKPSSMKGGCHS